MSAGALCCKRGEMLPGTSSAGWDAVEIRGFSCVAAGPVPECALGEAMLGYLRVRRGE